MKIFKSTQLYYVKILKILRQLATVLSAALLKGQKFKPNFQHFRRDTKKSHCCDRVGSGGYFAKLSGVSSMSATDFALQA
jgi:hypothetical protein